MDDAHSHGADLKCQWCPQVINGAKRKSKSPVPSTAIVVTFGRNEGEGGEVGESGGGGVFLWLWRCYYTL